jgi:alanyl-tRNA synthetase
MQTVEGKVNEMLLEDLAVTAQNMTQEQARKMGAMALFGEKYGDSVRVISVGDWAHELCGGTHAQRSGQLGVVTFLGEGSIGAGVRRIEALVGADAYQFLAKEHILVSRLTDMLKVPADQLPERIERTINALKDAERDLDRVKKAQLTASLDDIIGIGEDIGAVRCWIFEAPTTIDAGELRDLVMKAKGRNRPEIPVVMFGTLVADGKVSAIATANEKAIELGVGANVLLQAALPSLDGRGGGKPDMAQGGGANVAGVIAAIAAVKAVIAAKVAN